MNDGDDPQPPKLVAILGAGKLDKFAEDLRNLQRHLPHLVEHQKLVAKLTRNKFLALQAEGFTEAQALELSRSL